MDELDLALRPTAVIESDHPLITALADRLTANASDPAERARRLFEHTRDSIAYTVRAPFHLLEHYRATGILARGSGYCVQKSIVLVALARAARIPARLVFADIVNQRIPDGLAEAMGSCKFVWHCYTELHLGGRWLQATPSFDRALCERHAFPLVRFDGTRDAILPPVDEQGRPFVEYLAHHGSYPDLPPLDEMLAAWDRAYGAERVALWRQAASQESTTVPGL